MKPACGEAITQTLSLLPEVVWMDTMMPGLNELEATKRILKSRPETRVIVLPKLSLRREKQDWVAKNE